MTALLSTREPTMPPEMPRTAISCIPCPTIDMMVNNGSSPGLNRSLKVALAIED